MLDVALILLIVSQETAFTSTSLKPITLSSFCSCERHKLVEELGSSGFKHPNLFC